MPLGPASQELLYCFESSNDGTSCPNLALARGLCRRHYQRRWAKGQLPAREKKPTSTALTIRLPSKMHSALTKMRRANGRTLTNLIEDAISGYLQQFGLWPPK